MKKLLFLLPLLIITQCFTAQAMQRSHGLNDSYRNLPRNAQARINRHKQKHGHVQIHSHGHTSFSLKPIALLCAVLMIMQPIQAMEGPFAGRHMYGRPYPNSRAFRLYGFEDSQDCFRYGLGIGNDYGEECWRLQREEYRSGNSLGRTLTHQEHLQWADAEIQARLDNNKKQNDKKRTEEYFGDHF